MRFFFLLNLVIIIGANYVHYDDLTLKKCNQTSEYTIHGWWPEYNRKSWPSWCDPSRFSELNSQEIRPIQPLMKKYWSSCPGWLSNYNFWKHEWEKHGTCIWTDTVVGYFNHTIQAFLWAKQNNWFGCCDNNNHQCMIPFSHNSTVIQWLGYCY